MIFFWIPSVLKNDWIMRNLSEMSTLLFSHVQFSNPSPELSLIDAGIQCGSFEKNTQKDEWKKYFYFQNMASKSMKYVKYSTFLQWFNDYRVTNNWKLRYPFQEIQWFYLGVSGLIILEFLVWIVLVALDWLVWLSCFRVDGLNWDRALLS